MKYTNFIKCLLASIPLLSFWGCESEDLPNSGQGELVPVTIRLTTSAPDDVQTRANEHTAELVNNDYTISSLNVYITDGSSTTTLTESDFTFTGENEQDYKGTSNSTVELVRGKTYTVYALANTTPDINYQTNSPVDAIAMVNSTTNPNTVPMSAQTTWRIDGGIETIELVRMVAQMRVSIVQDDNNSGTNARTLTISDFKITNLLPATTNLYRSTKGSVTLPDNVGTLADWTQRNFTIGDVTNFYLHETKGEFTVSLHDGTRTRSNTFEREIPRNHILPLIIHLSDYRLDFTGSTYQHGPIGVIKNPEIADYTIALPSGASAVNLNIQLKDADGKTIDATWEYTLTQEETLPDLNLGVLEPDENGVLSILSDYDFPAGLTGTITLELTAAFTDDEGVAQTQKFTVTIQVKKIADEDLTRSASNEAEPIIVEL